MASHCKFWLPKKNRFCANTLLVDSLFCGNHTQRSDVQWIPCPIDSSHCVLEENLDNHLKRCPFLKQAQCLSRQPFYQEGINAGSEDDADDEDEQNAATFTSEMKRNSVYAMSVPKFLELIAKIKSVHASICICILDSYKIPEACNIWTNGEVDKKLPYQEKHVLQQASILGNLEELGVLKRSCLTSNASNEQCDSNGDSETGTDVPAVVEFGAGRGYLTQMLSDCYGINRVILVERKSYKLKADRSLRQKETVVLERLRIDIEDLNLNAVKSLQGVAYVAVGKHLCGPATDMTIRCCLQPQSGQDSAAPLQASCHLRGLAIATCCHHLCQWKSYISDKSDLYPILFVKWSLEFSLHFQYNHYPLNGGLQNICEPADKRYMSDLGLTKEDFHKISWFTSWAVDADHRSDFSATECSTQLESEKKEVCLDSDLREVGEIVRNMQAIERAVVGFMCKDIIDAGRLMWMKSQGLKSELVNSNGTQFELKCSTCAGTEVVTTLVICREIRIVQRGYCLVSVICMIQHDTGNLIEVDALQMVGRK